MKNITLIFLATAFVLSNCTLPAPEKKKATARTKHNYIVLLDLSDRLIVQQNQPQRDKQIIKSLYGAFERKVRKDLYIKSRDEFRVVIAPQLGTGVRRDDFEDRLYVNMKNISNVYRKLNEEDRRTAFEANLDTLYNNAVFSSTPEEYHGADIWKYFHEDLKVDYSRDTLTENFLIIITDGYPIVGHNRNKLLEVKNEFPDLKIALVEAAPREKDMEWDRMMLTWQEWFEGMGVKEYTLIKRGAITKELEQIKDVVDAPRTIAKR
ncbi:MAG TPA: hypothetical protein VK508_04955 [Cyclobacteriaceae bacterium]|nr:hypothetical protein [Cyclobacteriaceae bacterium]